MANVSPVSVGFKWGVITALISTILTLVFYFLKMLSNPIASLVSVVLLIALIFLAVKGFRDQNGTMSVGQGVIVGLILGLVSGVVGAVFTYVLYTFIDPNLLTTQMELQEQKLFESGMDEDQIEQTMAIASKFSNPALTSVFALIGSVIMSLLFSLVPAFVFKREHANKY